VRVGDRIADRTCTRLDGTSVRLYDTLGPAWALLGPEPLADIASERLGDVVALRGDRAALLVRPDGHLAWRGTDAAGLLTWLDRALGPRVGVLTP
jgi:4,5-epoxidase